MTWPLKLKAKSRPSVCELAGGLGAAPGDDGCPLGNFDIVSASTSASPLSSPRTDSTADSSGLPQHVAVDEAYYWSPASAPCDIGMRTGDPELDLVHAAWEAHEQQYPWAHGLVEEEHLLPPGLLSLADLDHMALGGLSACGSPPLGASASPPFGPLGVPPQLPPGLPQVWGSSLTECLHFDERLQFDQLSHNAFSGTGSPALTAAPAPQCCATEEEFWTTVMIRNLPNSYTRQRLLDLLDAEGFAGRYDFVYLPIDFASSVNLGYAFIDLVLPEDARCFMDHFTGFSEWAVGSEKVCLVSWSSPHQGLEQHVDRYRSSPVMHSSIPEDWKPLIFLNGVRVPFPPPTKHIKAPKVRGRSDLANAASQQEK